MRIKKRGISFDLIFYNPDNFDIKPFSSNSYNKFVTSSELNERINKMILPLANSFNCIDKILILNNEKNLFEKMKKYSVIYPRNYNPKYFIIEPLDFIKGYKFLKDNLVTIPYLKPSSLDLINTNIAHKKVFYSKYITLTLRDYGFSPSRNTNQSHIDLAFEVANNLNFKLVIVPDDINKLKIIVSIQKLLLVK